MPRRRKRTYGEGSAYQLPSGRWRAQFYGESGRVGATFDTESEARAFLRELATARDRGYSTPAPSPNLTLSAWIDRWLEMRKGNVAARTHQHDESKLRLHVKSRPIGSRTLATLTPVVIEDWLFELDRDGVSAYERHKAARVLRQSLKAATKAKVIPANPAADVAIPKAPRPEITVLSAEQAAALLKASKGDRFGPLIALALDTGARPGELFALHWPDLDLAAGTVRIVRAVEVVKGKPRIKETPKTSRSRRTLPIAPETAEALARHRERMAGEGRDTESGLVFCSPRGQLIRENNLWRRYLVPLSERAGLPPTGLYALRHTMATLLLAARVNVKVVSERLGHEDVQTTLRHYAHTTPTMQADAAREVSRILYGPIGTRDSTHKDRDTPQPPAAQGNESEK